MKSSVVQLPQLLWYDNDQLELQFPSSWDVTVCNMQGHDRPPISEERIRHAFANPIGAKPIRELARGKKEIAIVFDDMTRPTRVAEIVPYVLEELEAGGIKDESVRFIAATGAHGALTRLDFAKKLGEEVLSRFPVYNHNPYENLTFVGNTSRGTPVSINSEFMGCDLKVGIGCILPHPLTGFAGGGKIILPGIASIDTMAADHGGLIEKAITQGIDPKIGVGSFEENEIRLDIAEATRMTWLDIKIDAILNARGQTTDLFIGEPTDAHVEGVKLAREVYATKSPESPDIAILNTYCKANEANLALILTPCILQESQGDLVLIANAPDGQVPHYLARSFGKNIGGKLWFAPTTLPLNVSRLIIFTPYIDIAGADWIAPLDSIIWARTWPEVLEKLIKKHGQSAKVAVVPDATMQYFPSN